MRTPRFRLIASLAIAFLMLAAPFSSAFADEATPGWYVGGSAGAVFPGGVSTQGTTVNNATPTVAATTTATIFQGWAPQTGWGLGLQGGYDFNGPRVEGEFLYQSYGRPSTVATATVNGVSGSHSVGNGGMSTYGILLSGCYDFKNTSKVTPYLGAGVGVASITAGGTSSVYAVGNGTAAFTTQGISATVFAYQAKAGIAYSVNPATNVFLQYRYLGSSNFNYGGATLTAGGRNFVIAPASGHLSNSSVDVGVRFKL